MIPTTESSHWKLVDQILDELLDSPPAQRAAILTERCGGDADLRLEVETLLDSTEKAADFMEVSAIDTVSQSLDLEATESLIGKRVGKYRLLKLIGSGGMGKVFLASRTDKEFRKTVAVKLVNPIWNDEARAQTFRRERQILAKLEHPHIARLLDGGTTKDKVAFLVMEYVDGLPATEYCNQKCKTTNERLQIFLKVCEAVQFAHQNLVIHRDLKPNNILVTGDGTVKLLDFGVAKLLQPDLLDVSNDFTSGTNILTPNYASPEQLMGGTITTASDVYSLGVLLYELLSGNRPYDLKEKSLPEILRIISEEVLPRPSTSIADLGNGNAEAGPQGAIRSPRSLKGDLDNICLKALAKERSERYQTVEELSADINRHLASLPVLARQPSTWYRANKYVKRHRLGTAAAALITILVLGWLASALWQRNIARAQAAANLRRAYAADMNLGMQAYETANLSRLNEILARYQNTAFTSNWEYRFLRDLAKPKGQLLMIPHPKEVWDVTFSSDSKKMATACADGFARIYQVPDGKLLTTTAAKEINIWRVRFSPDGRFLATASGDATSTSVKVWNAESGAETLSLVGHTARVRGLDYSPDGKLIATGSRDGTIRIWSAVDGRELRKIAVERAGEPEETEDLHFTPDGMRLLTASKTTSRVWDIASGRILSTFEEGNSWSAAVSSDGKRFAVGGTEPRIRIFNAQTTEQQLVITGHDAKINNIVFSPDSLTIASASSDRTVKFSDAQTGVELQTLKTHLSEVWSVAFSPDGKFIATSGTDFRVFLFDASDLLQPSSFAFPMGFGSVWGGTISPDRSKVLSPLPGRPQDSEFTQTIWDVALRHKVVEFSTKVPVETGAFSPDGSILATGDVAGTISLWNTATGEVIRHFKAHEKRIVGIVFAPDGKHLISASQDKSVRIWSADNPAVFRELASLDGDVSALEVSPDGHRVVVASYDTTSKLIDFETEKIIAELEPGSILSVAFAPDGKTFATGDAYGAIEIRQTTDAKLLTTLTGNAGHMTALTYSPDGLRLASASGEGVIRLWDSKTGEQVLAIRTGAPETSFLAFTPDGNTLLSYGAGTRIQLWEAAAR
jgi:WD40 repeat protein/serine/threonine protein kinase